MNKTSENNFKLQINGPEINEDIDFKEQEFQSNNKNYNSQIHARLSLFNSARKSELQQDNDLVKKSEIIEDNEVDYKCQGKTDIEGLNDLSDFRLSSAEQKILSPSNETKIELNAGKTSLEDWENSPKMKRSNFKLLKKKTPRINPLAKIIGGALVSKVIDISEFIVKFNVGRFIRIYVYHLLFWYLGLFSVPIITLFEGMQLVSNMQFWFTKGFIVGFVNQLIQNSLNLILLLLFLNQRFEIFPIKTELKNIYTEQFIFVSVQIIVRCFIIAVRYGYSSQVRFDLMKSGKQKVEFVNKDLLVLNWFVINPTSIDLEIESAFWRNQVEDKDFYFMFFEKIQDNDTRERLTDDDYYEKNKAIFTMKKYKDLLQKQQDMLRNKQRTLHKFDPQVNDYDMFTVHNYYKFDNENQDVKWE
ncbi:UNKNOWN [Stylonychia lemnae]|uniref:Transmembrane protein n=1 Tax=Stylonychia lemnae TaxID=5949 RepID=A0A078ABJ9_STYLE|nr:UNKNOWN [Stylonychia lemnae]|eukprot:CDW79246.1 UNKNOWN [Stylonychia lemnae]